MLLNTSTLHRVFASSNKAAILHFFNKIKAHKMLRGVIPVFTYPRLKRLRSQQIMRVV